MPIKKCWGEAERNEKRRKYKLITTYYQIIETVSKEFYVAPVWAVKAGSVTAG